MRVPIVCASLIACTALFPPQYAAGEEPAGMIVTAPALPNTVGWTTRARDNPSIPTKRNVNIPSIEAPGQAPAKVSPERPRSAEVTRNSDHLVPVEFDEDAFLLPTWDRGFWVMPPGGLTRFLLPPRGFINPEETLAPGSLSANSG